MKRAFIIFLIDDAETKRIIRSTAEGEDLPHVEGVALAQAQEQFDGQCWDIIPAPICDRSEVLGVTLCHEAKA